MGKTENYFNFIVISLFLEKNSVFFYPLPFYPVPLKSSTFRCGGILLILLIVSWSAGATILLCCGRVYLCEKYSRTRRRCPRRSLSEVRDRTLV